MREDMHMHENVNGQRMWSTLEKITAATTVPTNGKYHPSSYRDADLLTYLKMSRQRLEVLLSLFAELDLRVTCHDFREEKKQGQTFSGTNALFRKNGKSPRTFLGCHHDCRYLGANDNATGMAVLLEVAYVLKDSPAINSVGFWSFDAEEAGRLGSQHCALDYRDAWESVEELIVVDSVGDRSPLHIWRETNQTPEQRKIIDGLHSSATMTGHPMDICDFSEKCSSDHTTFIERGIPATAIMAADYDAYLRHVKEPKKNIRFSTANHTDDTLENIHLPNLVATARMLVQYLMTRTAA